MLCAFFSCASSDVAAPKLGEDGSVALAQPAVETQRSHRSVRWLGRAQDRVVSIPSAGRFAAFFFLFLQATLIEIDAAQDDCQIRQTTADPCASPPDRPDRKSTRLNS